MNTPLKQAILHFELRKITKEELLAGLPFSIENKSVELRRIIDDVIRTKDVEGIEFALTLLGLLEENDEFTDLLHQLILEPWHTRYEDIIHDLQARKDPASIPVIKIAIQQKYDYLESYGTGTGQFISQCGHALWSIGTPEAIEVIEELAENSADPLIRDAMSYRMDKIRGNRL
ncbi:hypothetical protein D3C87_94750 [compost metagenome]